MSEKNLKEPSRHIFAVVSIAMGILVVLSAIPWSRLTGNKVKDFNLFEDLIPSSRNTAAPSQADIDPELESFLAEEKGMVAVGCKTEECPNRSYKAIDV